MRLCLHQGLEKRGEDPVILSLSLRMADTHTMGAARHLPLGPLSSISAPLY